MIYSSHYRYTFFLLAAFSITTSRTVTAAAGLSLGEILVTAMTNQPAILIKNNETDLYKGIFQSYKGQFDWRVVASLDVEQDYTPLTVEEAEMTGAREAAQRITTSAAGIEKQFTFGPVIGAGFENARTDDLDLGLDSIEKTSAKISLTVPLLRGRGRLGTAGNLLAAERDVEVSELTFLHEVSVGLSLAARAYWGYLSALEQLKIYEDSEAQMAKLVRDVQQLVEAQLRPAADLEQLRATLAEKTVQKLASEQALLTARNQLGEIVGLDHEDILRMPSPSDPFPHTLQPNAFDKLRLEDLFAEACRQRKDIKAAYKTLESKTLLLKSARRNSRPRLDLVLSAGQSILDNGDRLPQYAGEDTTYASIMIKGDYPIGNNTPSGELEKSEAEYAIARINVQDLSRRARSRIEIALEGLKRSSRSVQIAEDSAGYYETTLKNEGKKLKLGKSTVIDLLYLEDKYRSALLTLTRSREAYANALVTVKHETATIITHDEDTDVVFINDLTRIPTVEGAE